MKRKQSGADRVPDENNSNTGKRIRSVCGGQVEQQTNRPSSVSACGRLSGILDGLGWTWQGPSTVIRIRELNDWLSQKKLNDWFPFDWLSVVGSIVMFLLNFIREM